MKAFNKKILLAITVYLYVNVAFSQHKNVDTLQLVISTELETFTKKIEIAEYNSYFYNEVTLNNGSYKIRNKSQEADFIVENNLISGTVITYENFKKGKHKEGDSFKTEYKFDKSLVTEYTMFADDVLFVEAYRKFNQIYGKEFYKDGKIATEGQTSLKSDKSYGLTIAKSYDKEGKIYQIDDEISETITQFYANGNKKSFMDKTSTTYFNEDEIIIRKVNFKIPPFYDDLFVNGELSTRSYRNNKNEQVKEYFKNGTLDKKELTHTISAEKTILTYNKAGKIINKQSYKVEEEENRKARVYPSEVVNNQPEQYTTEQTETVIVEANFHGGNEAFRKYIIDNFDTSVTESEEMMKFELNLMIDADGTVSLENRQQKIYTDKELADEINRVLKKSPKWNPATENGIPVKSSVRFPVTINIQQEN